MKHKFILSKEGYLVNKKMVDMVEINKLKNELTVEPFKFGVTFGAKVENEFFEANLSYEMEFLSKFPQKSPKALASLFKYASFAYLFIRISSPLNKK